MEKTSQQKMDELLDLLRNTGSDIENDWTSKRREKFIYDKILSLSFVISGNFILENKKCIKHLKSVYLSDDPTKFTTKELSKYFDNIDENLVYVILEPFGSQLSPDFLLISNKSICGVEDKSSQNSKISWNTGTPGGNKIIMYYDRKINKVFLVCAELWGWTDEIEKKFREETKKWIQEGKQKFKENFYNLPNFNYLPRPMLIDNNKVKDIWDEEEIEVKKRILKLI